MASEVSRRPIHEHDWLSDSYVEEWIGHDLSRDAERRPVLAQMLTQSRLAANSAPRVLDVGAGYGVVTEEVLRRFPSARVTLLDYSAPMFERARARLVNYAEQIEFLKADLLNSEWTARTGTPFDLAVSAIAIHNLRDHGAIQACYKAITAVLRPGAEFLDCDLVSFSGGLEAHLQWLRAAGFADVRCTWQQSPSAVLHAVMAGPAKNPGS